jgi:catechol 2,3-dioxygenase-like lactoylglutathione lyase family enzyme
MVMPIRKVDVVGIPSSDGERSRQFYAETLGLGPDENSRNEFWTLTLHGRYAPYADDAA